MADYYSECACLIEANHTQTAILLEAMNELFEPDDSFIQKLISCDNTNDLSEMEIIVRHCVLNHPDRTVANIPEDLDWHFDGDKCPEGFLINSDLGDFNSEHAALFAQAALIAFDRNELIEFKIAFTCSSSKRPDGFGGAACVVSKDFIRWTGLHNFLEAERTAFAEKMNYFFCEFTEVVGELEYPVSFILRCPDSVNAAHRYDEIQLNYRDGGEIDAEGGIQFSSGSAIKKSSMKPITPDEFRVMKSYLNVM
ncbi:TPA: hypothetical protein PIP00_004934 [Klebsiella pneumoniae]|uniref:Uncharacterized protein n=1 Tax=Klebsiella pneumoniae TaxID=573 RepID=A0A377ZPI3_KLEPN|nr:hypothetical protein [Klebsiella pneumoniae subsp. ozaenae]STU22198.1 Uncharacterised protein [Klebsiella pneumoniae]STU79193.1 Uncharacterised protein [Klebsiella pneumoniae]STV63967.1 Uncharacterised protein [Klebsiella pneumoniae]STW25872.1 Uncharacterised protein [Klebsiella pneumoniae]